MRRRLPIESGEPVVAFAWMRLAIAVGSLGMTLAVGLPAEGRLLAVLAAGAIPWSVAMLVLARRSPEAALNPLVAGGDFAVLVAVELVYPESYGAVRFAGLFLIAVHSHLQGEQRGLALAAAGAGAVVLASALREGGPVDGGTLVFYEAAFVVAALGTSVLVGRLRTTESASRVRARRLTRRMIESEHHVRRQVSEAIHDGPVQELIGMDMMLAAADRAAADGDSGRAQELVADAREVATRNVQLLRDEIVGLGPYAFEELTFDVAIANCVPVWRKRYGIELALAIEPVSLTPEVADHLFAIAQEAVVNAGRHAEPDTVAVTLRSLNGELELRVSDDGKGFGGPNPLSTTEPGHLGLACVRERVELLGGTFEIDSTDRGTTVVVRAPLRRRTRRGLRARGGT